MGVSEVISNYKVYGLEDSIKASKYPMSVDISKCTHEITDTTKRLAGCVTGTGHDNFLNGIVVQFDLTFTIKAWTEAQRYHFLDFVSSQSTMHRIAKFDIGKQCIEYVRPELIAVVEEQVAYYNANPTAENYLRVLYNVPVGFRLTARMTTNYRQLKTIYQQRKNHRLPEWRVFCQWISELPHSYLIIGEEGNHAEN
ncbi:MAG: hypothetical protein J6S05_05615 [Bacteroidaceae bacterium]|nr:hypothetical protein [Bacteroidaceae bacterium]